MELQLTRSPSSAWKLPLGEEELRDLLLSMLEELGCKNCSLELALVDDAEIAELNLSYLGCSGPTNVLSFPSTDKLFTVTDDNSSSHPWSNITPDCTFSLGWIALSADTLQREAMLFGRELVEHAIFLMAHGLVHLMGYDHGPDMDHLSALAATAGIKNYGN